MTTQQSHCFGGRQFENRHILKFYLTMLSLRLVTDDY